MSYRTSPLSARSACCCARSDPTGADCGSNSRSADCSIVQPSFPYCTCRPGATQSTPYNVNYKRMFKVGGAVPVNVYCFSVAVDLARCSGSPCCNPSAVSCGSGARVELRDRTPGTGT
jgi:hypothetical protein